MRINWVIYGSVRWKQRNENLSNSWDIQKGTIMSEARKAWNKRKEDENFIRENYDRMSAREIGEILGMSREAVNRRVRGMGLRKTKFPFLLGEGEEIRELNEAPGYGITNKSRVVNLKNSTLLKPKVDRSGYLRVTMFPSGNRIERRVHRMVAEYFIPNPEQLPHVNHIDGNKKNANIHNLEWITPLGNSRHALAMGLLRVGEDVPTSVISEKQAIAILEDSRRGLSNSEIRRRHPYATKSIVEKIANRTRWKHLDRIS